MASFEEALKYCDTCPVTGACLSEALANGDHVWSVRGGKTPYDHEGVSPGRIEATGPSAPERTLAARTAIYRAFLEGRGTTNFSGHVKDWLKGEKERLTAGPETASWDYWRPPSGRGNEWPAGGGWVVSQDVTRSVVLVLVKQGDGSLKRRLANTRYVRYDSSIAPKLLKEWPEGMDLPEA